jgi:hypothetical protein
MATARRGVLPGLFLCSVVAFGACGGTEPAPQPSPQPEAFVGRWSSPLLVGDAGPGQSGSRLSGDGGSITGVLLDDAGRGVVLFSNLGDRVEPEFQEVHAVANTYSGGLWGTPVGLSGDQASWNLPNALAGDGRGGAIAVWQRTGVEDGGDLESNRYSVEGRWQPAVSIVRLPQSTNAPRAQIVEGSDGTALMAWTDTELRLARVSPTGARGVPTAIGPPAFFFVLVGTPGDPLVGFTDNGRLLYSVPDGAGGWQPAVEVPGAGSVVTGFVGGFGAAADQVGGFTFAWFRSDATGNPAGVVSARYDAATGWSAPVSVETGAADAGERAVKVVAGPAGHVLAYWLHGDGRLWGNRYTPGSGWGRAGPVSTAVPLAQSGLPPGTSAALGATAGIDGSGNALVLWADAGTRLFSVRAAPGRPWSAAQALPLDPATHGVVGPLALAMNASGSALAAWAEPSACDTCPAPRAIWAALYEPH